MNPTAPNFVNGSLWGSASCFDGGLPCTPLAVKPEADLGVVGVSDPSLDVGALPPIEDMIVWGPTPSYKRPFSLQQRLSQTLASMDFDGSTDEQARKRERLSLTLAQAFAPLLETDTKSSRMSLCMFGPSSFAGVPPLFESLEPIHAGQVNINPRQVAVGRNAEFSFDTKWLCSAHPEAAERLTGALNSIHRAFEVFPGEFPECTSGRDSARRVGIPVFTNPQCPSLWVCEFDLAWSGSKCLNCVSVPDCKCQKPILLSHRPDRKSGCQSGMLWDREAARFSCRMHIDEKFHTSSLPSPNVKLTITFYDSKLEQPAIFWDQEFDVVSRNKHYRRDHS